MQYGYDIHQRIKTFYQNLCHLVKNNPPLALIIDDDLTMDKNLSGIGRKDIDTDGGTIAGTELVKEIVKDKRFTSIPIIIYSVHGEEVIKERLGDLVKDSNLKIKNSLIIK